MISGLVGLLALWGCAKKSTQAAGPPPQFAAIARWIGQAVHVVDPNAVDRALGVESKYQGVDALERLFVFHAQAYEIVDVEKPTPVDAIARRAPPAQTVGASLRQAEFAGFA